MKRILSFFLIIMAAMATFIMVSCNRQESYFGGTKSTEGFNFYIHDGEEDYTVVYKGEN